jgi:predicted nucleic acid-binding protein
MVMTSDLVLADTNIWIDYFKVRNYRYEKTINNLIDAQTMATTGVIVAEVLHGSRSKAQFEEVADMLSGLAMLDTTEPVWWSASRLTYRLKEQGETLPLPDIVIAAVALEYECSLFTEDLGFRRIPELQFFEPAVA